MAKPIFVIGKNRSGTKWLSNIIASHSDVAAIQSEATKGIIETNLLHIVPQVFGTPLIEENYVGFVEWFAQTDFFKVSGLSKEFLYANRPQDYCECFRRIMDAYSASVGCGFWVQKASTFSLGMLYERFPDAKFLLITRNAIDNIRSVAGLQVRRRPDARPSLLPQVTKYFLEYKRLQRYHERANAMPVRFELIRDEREATIRNVCAFLGLGFQRAMLEDRYEKNSSYRGGVTRQNVLAPRQEVFLRVLLPVLGAIPYPVYEAVYALRRRAFGESFLKYDARTFVSGTFTQRLEEIRDGSGPGTGQGGGL